MEGCKEKLLENKIISITASIFNNLENRRLLQIGSCEVSCKIVKHFIELGCLKENIIILDNQNNPLKDYEYNILKSDIIVLASTAFNYYITNSHLENIVIERKKQNLLIFDVLHHKSIEVRLSKVKDIFYFHFSL
ncbi:hypothetical protein [Alkalihalophilus pseudofirmus]|uniref:hypothetical protein n=1 Tax=Alkalihalophilus pseudofirmus TaxID=79885 RepID=UPI00338DD0F3